jgi:gliding motility-associated-like protein
LFIDVSGNDTIILKSRLHCWQVDTVIIHAKECPPNIEDLIFVPNAFTPNNDGKNDVFKIQGFSITNVKMEVYNRWGEKLFSDSDVEISWDGKYSNLETPEGIYVVVLSISYIDSNGNEKIKFVNKAIQLLR